MGKERLIGDKAYDSDAFDRTLGGRYDVEMISPSRSNRKQKTLSIFHLRGYPRRWKIERVFAWIQNYRRLVTQWKYYIEHLLGLVQLACLLMLLRHWRDGL
jgi:transposase